MSGSIRLILSSLFTSMFAVAAPAISGVISGVLANAPSSDSYISSIVLGALLVFAIFAVFFSLRTIYRFPRIRRLLGKMHPYEGVWVESYNVEENDNGGETILVPHRSVMIIRLDPKDNKLKIYGRTFERDDITKFGRYSGNVMQEDVEDRLIEYRYKGEYSDGNPVRGYGFLQFDENINKPGYFTSAVGKWIELEAEKKAWMPHTETKARLIDRKQVRSILNKDYPDHEKMEDFYILSKYA